MENNSIVVSGEVVSDFEYSHMSFGETYNSFFIRSARYSGTDDVLKVIVSTRIMQEIPKGMYVEVIGSVRTYTKHVCDKTYVDVHVFADKIRILDEPVYVNEVTLNGYICRKPIYRETPLGRRICDTLIAVNRIAGSSVYIPTILWGKSAESFSKKEVGSNVILHGRLQSREYLKKHEDGTEEMKTAYEFSVAYYEDVEVKDGCEKDS